MDKTPFLGGMDKDQLLWLLEGEHAEVTKLLAVKEILKRHPRSLEIRELLEIIAFATPENKAQAFLLLLKKKDTHAGLQDILQRWGNLPIPDEYIERASEEYLKRGFVNVHLTLEGFIPLTFRAYALKAAQETQEIFGKDPLGFMAPGTTETKQVIGDFLGTHWGITKYPEGSVNRTTTRDGVEIFLFSNRYWKIRDRLEDKALLYAYGGAAKETPTIGQQQILLLRDKNRKRGYAVSVPAGIETAPDATAWHHNLDPHTFEGFAKEV